MNLLYVQSGGPTSVINCSMYGVIQSAKNNDRISSLIGAKYGIAGVFNENFVDLLSFSNEELDLLKTTPSMSLGSSRYALDDSEYVDFISILQKKRIDGIIFNGGNGTAKFCERLVHELEKQNYPCKVIMIPKTVDNDLAGIDFAPGFLSAANYIVTTIRELANDLRVYDSNLLLIVEVMGRDSGWLAATAKLADKDGYGPDLIYLPEKALDFNQMISDVQKIYQKKGKCLIVISEGIRNKKSEYIFQEDIEDTNQVALGMSRASIKLASLLGNHFSCKIRTVDLNLMQRCSSHLTSTADKKRAEMLGRFAIDALLKQNTGVMVTIKELAEMTLVNIQTVAKTTHHLPIRYITSEGNNIDSSYCALIEPYLDPIKKYFSIQEYKC